MNNTSNTNANMTNTSLDIPAYLTIHLGDRYVSTVQLIVLNVIYIGIFLSGTIGNICTCIVIARNRNMHTATNYYLVSLAVADLLTLGIGKLYFHFICLQLSLKKKKKSRLLFRREACKHVNQFCL